MSTDGGYEEVVKERDEYDYDTLNADKKLLDYYNTALSRDTLTTRDQETLKSQVSQLTKQNNDDDRLLVKYKDLVFLQRCLKNSRSKDDKSPSVYIYELMMLTVLELPSPAPITRSPELQSRLVRLRLEAAEADYQSMTKNVSSKIQPTENLGQELKKMDSQVTFLLNFLLTVVGAFAFGYKAVEYSLETPNVSIQLTAGVTLATIVFFADIYFIIKDYV